MRKGKLSLDDQIAHVRDCMGILFNITDEESKKQARRFELSLQED